MVRKNMMFWGIAWHYLVGRDIMGSKVMIYEETYGEGFVVGSYGEEDENGGMPQLEVHIGPVRYFRGERSKKHRETGQEQAWRERLNGFAYGTRGPLFPLFPLFTQSAGIGDAKPQGH